MKIIYLFVCLFSLSNCNYAMDKYKWLPTECAPKNYPVRILKGDLIYENGESIFIPDNRIVNNGWGEIGSTLLVGDEIKPIPHKLTITWFSYTEDKFYQGNFDLPYDKITTLFKNGFVRLDNNAHVTYDRIVIGLAPGGVVTIWLNGSGASTEVIQLKANETEIEWSSVNKNPSITRKQYIETNLKYELSPDTLIALKKYGIPFGLWENKYRSTYHWKPILIGHAIPTNFSISYFDGESEYIRYNGEEQVTQNKKVVPKSLKLHYSNDLRKKYLILASFDEEEIFASFAKLSEAANQELKLQIEINSSDQSVKFFLKNDKNFLELLKCDTKIYSE